MIYTWPYTVLPTLLYTWQYYDMVEIFANANRSVYLWWVRSAFVVCLMISLVSMTLLNDYGYTWTYWYIEIFSNHFDLEKADNYAYYTNRFRISMGSLMGLCCLASAAQLGGTVYWVRHMMVSQDSSVMTGSLNLPFASTHIFLLII